MVNRNAIREPSSRHSHKRRFACNTLVVQLLQTPPCCHAVIEVVENPSAYPLHVRGVNQNVLTVHWRVDQIKSGKRERGGVAEIHRHWLAEHYTTDKLAFNGYESE